LKTLTISPNKEKLPENRKRKALDVAGCFSSDAQDVSTRHDDYLAEAYEKRES
jgi:hypothetical protein